MKLIIAFCSLVASLVVGTAAAAQGPPALNRETALNAPVDRLARDALAAVASRFVEVERPTFTGRAGADAPLMGLEFATAAVGSGDPGLCKATAVWVDLESVAEPIASRAVYKIVGDLAPLPDMWNDAYGADLARKCATAGRVLPSESADFGQVGFFNVTTDNGQRIWVAARALQLAIAGASTAQVACVPPPPLDDEVVEDLPADDPVRVEDRQTRDGCAHAAETLAGLDLDRLVGLGIVACADNQPDASCLSATFLRHAEFNHRALWTVTLRYEQGLNGDRDAVTVSDVRLTADALIVD